MSAILTLMGLLAAVAILIGFRQLDARIGKIERAVDTLSMPAKRASVPFRGFRAVDWRGLTAPDRATGFVGLTVVDEAGETLRLALPRDDLECIVKAARDFGIEGGRA